MGGLGGSSPHIPPPVPPPPTYNRTYYCEEIFLVARDALPPWPPPKEATHGWIISPSFNTPLWLICRGIYWIQIIQDEELSMMKRVRNTILRLLKERSETGVTNSSFWVNYGVIFSRIISFKCHVRSRKDRTVCRYSEGLNCSPSFLLDPAI